jgi:hypothetical protein
MVKKRVEISEELKFKLQEMKRILGGVPDDNSFDVSAGGCGGVCKITCSYYCERTCSVSCAQARGNAFCQTQPGFNLK